MNEEAAATGSSRSLSSSGLGGSNTPSAYMQCIREHLHRNLLFRRIGLSHRFTAVVEVELLNMRNLSPSSAGLAKLGVYAVLRLKHRSAGQQSTMLSSKVRTTDSVVTDVAYIDSPTTSRLSTPAQSDAPWGAKIVLRFALPEEALPPSPTQANAEAASPAENLTRGPPQVLHICVYQKRALSIVADPFIGEVEVPLAALSDDAQLAQWLPLRMAGSSAWFIHLRVSLHFALMQCARQGGDGAFGEIHTPVRTTSLSQHSPSASASESALSFLVDD